MAKVESFSLDHNKVKAPYIRMAGMETNQGVVIQKFDLRFLQPNHDALPTAALHTLEHLLAVNYFVASVVDLCFCLVFFGFLQINGKKRFFFILKGFITGVRSM